MENPIIDKKIAEIYHSTKDFRNLKLPGGNFRGLDLSNANFSGVSVPFADFTDANLTYANCDRLEAIGAKFRNTKLYRTNFKDANLSQSEFAPSDCYGMTITLQCKSFQGMKITSGWWYGWLLYALLMEPPDKVAGDSLIQLMGVERFSALKDLYTRRGL